jgi:hypothetical protein
MLELPDYEPGWIGALTRAQAEGAYPNGSRVVKRDSEPGDAHRTGDKATVLGSLRFGDKVLYWVEWDDAPMVAIAVVAEKIGLADDGD